MQHPQSLNLALMAVKLLEQCRISPLPPSSPRPPLPLTFFDIPWLDLPAVERLFFYRFPHPAPDFLATHLPALKSGLATALDRFYPLAGTIRRRFPDSDRFEIRHTDGDGVPLSIAEYVDADFVDVAGRQAREVGLLVPLVPPLPKCPDAQPLLALQVTLFPNQDLCVALKVHHAACDGFSSIHFVKTWAAACRTAVLLPPPSLDRSPMEDPRNIYSKFAHFVLRKRSNPQSNQNHTSPSPSPPPKKAATFTFRSSQIQTLKQRFHAKAAKEGKPCSRISTFVVSCAHAWVSLVKARGFTLSSVAHLFFSVDWRNRMRPPAPAYYFGNCLGCPCFVKAMVGDISSEKDGVLVACELIAKAIDVIGEDVHESMEGMFGKLMEVLPQQPLSIAGSPKLGVYGVDFGWGKPEKVEVTSIREMGAISMSESVEEEGGVEIGVMLTENEVVEFGLHFNSIIINKL